VKNSDHRSELLPKEKAIGDFCPQTPTGHSSPAAGQGLLAFSRELDASTQRIKELEEEIHALKAQWPAHSVKAWMLQQLEDLEEELAQLKISQETRNDGTNKDAKPKNSYPRSKLRGISEFSLRDGFCYILEPTQQAAGYSVKLNNAL